MWKNIFKRKNRIEDLIPKGWFLYDMHQELGFGSWNCTLCEWSSFIDTNVYFLTDGEWKQKSNKCRYVQARECSSMRECLQSAVDKIKMEDFKYFERKEDGSEN